MENKDIVSTINRLIETCKDGEAGFRACAQDLNDPVLKTTFTERAEGCAAAAAELQQLVHSLGGVPELTSSIGGMLHRRWVDIKSAITGKDNLAVLKECERGEELALKNYQDALAEDLPPEIRSAVERQLEGVQHNRNRIAHLRNSAEAAAKLAH